MASDDKKSKPIEKAHRQKVVSSIQPKPSVTLSPDERKRIQKSKISRIDTKPDAISDNAQNDSPAIQSLKTRGYKIIERLGEGNYSQVYRIVTRTLKEMAVKIIDMNKVSNHYKMRFLPRELEIISRLKHDGIIQVYTIEVSKLFCFIFMEYAPNGTLADFIRRNGPTPEWIARSMVKRIIRALLYLHTRGIAHRDLKLENILLDKRSIPKLSDFSYSLVCIRDPATGGVDISKTFCGSIPYMAPELLTQKPYDPKKADIWSLGICIFILINDRIPFDPNDVSKMVKAQTNKQFEFRKKVDAVVSDECKDFIRKMLEPIPKLRPSCETLSEHRWFSIEKSELNKPNVSRVD